MCHNSSTCTVYIMWVELGHSHFIVHMGRLTCQPFILGFVTLFVTLETGAFQRHVHLLFRIDAILYKPLLYLSVWSRSTTSFHCVEE